MSGGGPAADEGRLLVMVGGDADVVERCRPVFETYADPVVHLGELGSGQTTKLLNNLLFTANLGTAATALSLAKSLGVAPDRLTEVVSRSSGNSFALNAIGGTGGLDRLAGLAGTLLQKDVRLVVDLAEEAAARGGRRARRGRRRADPDGSPPVKVGFIGAGRMGRDDGGASCRRPATTSGCWSATRRITPSGAISSSWARPSVNEVADAAAQADVVVLCVFTDEQVRQVCLDSALLSTMGSGSTLVVHTTASPKTIEAIAARSDIDVVDAPVSGGPHDIAAGKLTLFVGGADDTVARLRPILGCYGDPVLHVGPIGAGQTVKLVNNALFAGHIGLLAEAIRLGERLGVPESTVLGALAHGSATSRVLDIVAARGSVAAFIEVAGEFVGKDVAVVRSIAEDLGNDLGALDDVIEVLGAGGKV